MSSSSLSHVDAPTEVAPPLPLTDAALLDAAAQRGISAETFLEALEIVALAMGGTPGEHAASPVEEVPRSTSASGEDQQPQQQLDLRPRKRARVVPFRAHVSATLAELLWRSKSASIGQWLTQCPLRLRVCRSHLRQFNGRPSCLQSLARAISRSGCGRCPTGEFASESGASVTNMVASLEEGPTPCRGGRDGTAMVEMLYRVSVRLADNKPPSRAPMSLVAPETHWSSWMWGEHADLGSFMSTIPGALMTAHPACAEAMRGAIASLEPALPPDLRARLQTQQQQQLNLADVLRIPAHTPESADQIPAQPANVHVQLKPHQRVGCAWMLEREKTPFWQTCGFWAPTEPEPVAIAPFFGCFSRQPDDARGGMLLDEMGTGKTFTVLGAVLGDLENQRAWQQQQATTTPEEVQESAAGGLPSSSSSAGVGGTGQQRPPVRVGTLIVVPTAMVGQWVDEAGVAAGVETRDARGRRRLGSSDDENPLRICAPKLPRNGVANCDERRRKEREAIQAADLVVLPQNAMDLLKETLGARFQFYRVVFDEAHTLSALSSKLHQSAKGLEARSKWAVTGTPCVREAGEILQLARLVGFHFFRPRHGELLQRAQYDGAARRQRDTVLRILHEISIRRNSSSRVGGEPVLLKLGFDERVEHVQPTDDERLAHDIALEALARRAIRGLELKRWVDHLRLSCSACPTSSAQLQRMLDDLPRALERAAAAAAANPSSSRRAEMRMDEALAARGATLNERAREAIENLRTNGEAESCEICLDLLEQPTITPCNHIFCYECVSQALQRPPPRCPLCRASVQTRQLCVLTEAPPPEEEPQQPPPQQPEDEQQQQLGADAQQHLATTKARALLDMVVRWREADMEEERQPETSGRGGGRLGMLVFTHFNNVAKELTALLRDAFPDLAIGRVDGGTATDARGKAFADFQEGRLDVLVLTLRTCAAGITLTAARRTVFAEACIHPDIRQQAIDRVCRMGQKHRLQVTTLVHRGTLEERLARSDRPWNVNDFSTHAEQMLRSAASAS